MKGAYCLVLEVLHRKTIEIGKLGNLTFEKGFYIYTGSALNNLEKRVERHTRKDKKKHWHIDYLTCLESVRIKRVYFRESSKREECQIAREVSKHGLPIEGFGCSDCKCLGHLYKVRNFRFLEGFMNPMDRLSE